MRYELGRWIANKLQNLLEDTSPRVIANREGTAPYLSRFYVRGAPTMPDGSDPIDTYGNPKKGAKFHDGWGLYIHRFHDSDAPGELHDHPWSWALSFILAGGYIEERRKEVPGNSHFVEKRIVAPFSFNFLRSTDFHRVDLIEHDAWTLFLVGPKVASWGFWNPKTGRYMDWRSFLTIHRRAEVTS